MTTKTKERKKKMPTAVKEETAKKSGRLSKGLREFQRQVIEYQKATIEGTFDAIVAFQDQQEQFVNSLLERTSVLPEEGKEVITEWIETFKRGREDFKKTLDHSYELVENYFDRVEEEAEEAEEEEEAGEE